MHWNPLRPRWRDFWDGQTINKNAAALGFERGGFFSVIKFFSVSPERAQSSR